MTASRFSVCSVMIVVVHVRLDRIYLSVGSGRRLGMAVKTRERRQRAWTPRRGFLRALRVLSSVPLESFPVLVSFLVVLLVRFGNRPAIRCRPGLMRRRLRWD